MCSPSLAWRSLRLHQDERRDEHEAHHRGRGDAQGDGRLALGDAEREGEREHHPRGRLGDQEGGEEREAASAAQVAPREERRAEGHDGGEQDPVEGLRSGEEPVLERLLEGRINTARHDGDGELDPCRGPDRGPDVLTACDAVGERAGEQLLDRPVGDRDRHEDGRPQNHDLAVLGGIQVVRGESEEEVREHARGAHARRQEACRAPEAPSLRAGAHFAHRLKVSACVVRTS